jgi:hypothetical protein
MNGANFVAGSIITCCTILSGCCAFPTKQPPGVDRDKVASEVTQLVRRMRWQPVTGTSSCHDNNVQKKLGPRWVQITVSMLDQRGVEGNPSLSTPVPIGIVTPTLGNEVKDQHGMQTDSVIVVNDLGAWATWPKPPVSTEQEKTWQKEADDLSTFVEKAEMDLVTGGDSDKPCLGVVSVAISTILDIVQTINGEVKIGIGPFAVADLKANVSKESKATTKFEIHYVGDPPANQQQLMDEFLQQFKLFQQQK